MKSVGYEEVVILLQLQSHSLCKSTHEMILPYFLASSHIHKHNARSTHRSIKKKNEHIFQSTFPSSLLTHDLLDEINKHKRNDNDCKRSTNSNNGK